MTDQGRRTPAAGDRTLVIIPTFNELENLPLIMGQVHKALPDVHILVVDDGSPDRTGQLADELALADPDRVRHAPRRQGRPGCGLPGRLRLGAGPPVQRAGGDGR